MNLPSVLDAAHHSSLSVEIVVVDNAPSDSRTKDLVARTGCCSYVVASERGLARARNAGVEACRGQIVLFVDDDVAVPLTWVDDMCRQILEGSCDVVAGSVTFGADRHKEWLGPLVTVAACAVTSNADGDPGHTLVGANFACRRSVFDLLQFDRDLGAGSAYGSGEDALFDEHCKTAGFDIRGASVAVVHNFDPARLERGRLRTAAARNGRSAAFIAYHWVHSDLRWLHVRIALGWVRMQWSAGRNGTATSMSDTEWRRRVAHAQKLQLLTERRRARLYDQWGLVRRA